MLYIPFPFKRCSKCGVYRLATREYFYVRNRRKRRGLDSWCKSCNSNSVRRFQSLHSEAIRERKACYRIEHLEKIRQANKRYYQSHKQQRYEYAKKYKKDHPDRWREYQQRYGRTEKCKKRRRLNNQDDNRKAYQQKWRKDNLPRKRLNNQRREAKKRTLASTFSESNWTTALAWFNGTCAYCEKGISLFDQNYTLHQDHFIPLSSNGAFVAGNILPACQSCNFSKHDNDPQEWLVKKFGPRKTKAILKRIQDYFDWVKTQVK